MNISNHFSRLSTLKRVPRSVSKRPDSLGPSMAVHFQTGSTGINGSGSHGDLSKPHTSDRNLHYCARLLCYSLDHSCNVLHQRYSHSNITNEPIIWPPPHFSSVSTHAPPTPKPSVQRREGRRGIISRARQMGRKITRQGYKTMRSEGRECSTRDYCH